MPARRSTSTGATTEAAFRSLLRVGGLMRRVMEPHFARFGITPSQWGVLCTLHRAEKAGLAELRLTDLGDRLLVRLPSVTGVIDRLERLGLVVRTASETDLRTKHVGLTPAGRALAERILKGHAARIRTVMGGLTAQKQERLHRLLDRLASHLGSLVDRQEGAAPPAVRRPLGQRNQP